VDDLIPGTLVGARYQLERRLGEGGMGVVWAAEDTVTHQQCAVKLMKDSAGDPDARRRFLREGRAASAVHHPSVVNILDVLEPDDGNPAEPDDGNPAIVMELLAGESLRAFLQRERRIPLGLLADILVPVVSAVGTAHALGIVHRDRRRDPPAGRTVLPARASAPGRRSRPGSGAHPRWTGRTRSPAPRYRRGDRYPSLRTPAQVPCRPVFPAPRWSRARWNARPRRRAR